MTSASEGARTELSRDLGLFTITMIGVGAMVGAGIFVLTGEAAGIAGPALILSFALNGLVTIFTAMVYAELGSAIPEAGGGYLWIREGLPGANAFLAGWMSWFAHSVAGALYALGFGAFVFELARLLGMDWAALGLEFVVAKKSFGIAVAVAFAWINFMGSSETGLAGNVVTLAKLGIIGVFCAFGVKYMFAPEAFFEVAGGGGMGTSQLRPFIPEETGWLGILSAMGLTFIAFEGYEIIVQSGEEVKDPRRNIPKAVFWSLAIVVPIYMLVAFVLVGATHTDQLLQALREIGIGSPEGIGPDSPSWAVLRHVGELGLARAASQFVPYGAVLILAGGMLSTMSALNATTFSSTRVAFAMGRDRSLPDAFGEIHGQRRTPHVALSWTAVLIVAMVAFVPITTVAAAADIMFLLLFLQVNVAVITLRKKYGDALAYGYLMPFFPVVPVVGIVTKLGLALFMFDHYPVAWVYVAGWVVVGFGIYHFWASGRKRPEEELPVVVEEAPVEVSPHSVLVGIAEPRAGRELARLGTRIAEATESEVLLLHVISVPRQLPLKAGRRWVPEARETLDGIREAVEARGVPVRSLIRLAHRPADAIVETALERKSDYLILGWEGPERPTRERRQAVIGPNADRVIKGANAHAVIYETRASRRESAGRPDGSRVLVPVSDADDAPLALGIAASLLPRSEREGRRITLLHLSEEEPSADEEEEFRQAVRERLQEKEREEAEEEAEPVALLGEDSMISFECRAVERSARDAVIRLSEDYDRLVIPAGTESGFLARRVIDETARAIVAGARCPTVVVRPRSGALRFRVQSFFQYFRDLEEEPEEEDTGESGVVQGGRGERDGGHDEDHHEDGG